MSSKKRYLMVGTTGLLVTFLVISFLQLPVVAQGNGGNVIPNTWWRKALLFLNTIAEAIGGFLVFMIKRITRVELTNLTKPLGYLAELTLFLMAIDILEGAKKILWLIVLAGWGLIAVRVVVDVLQTSPGI